MELYFLRHGLAGQHGDPKYRDDSLRPLTPEGQEKMDRAACGMRALDLQFDAIISSPYLRARQTAEIVFKNYRAENKIYYTKNLLPPATIKDLLKEIYAQYPKAQRFLLVGHEPHLTQMISQLLGCDGALSINFKKGGLCYLSTEGPANNASAVFQWLLTSTQLGLMAK